MPERLAVNGGKAVRETMLPYGRQNIDDGDIAAVVEVLRSDWLTTGPKVAEFEQAFAETTGAVHAVAVANGTAALHCAIYALNIQPGDEVIVTPMTFAASANCILYQGGTPVFADVEPDTLLIDPERVREKVTPRTKAIVSVDYTGQPANYAALREIADQHGLSIIADACHAIGGSLDGRPVGTLANLSTFSLHPVKHITTGEGGVITTGSAELAQRMRVFRNHGITSDHRQRALTGGSFYEMVDLGYNYRITDIQCALGISQLKKLGASVEKRRRIASWYDAAFARTPFIQPLTVRDGAAHAYHLYVALIDLDALNSTHAGVYAALRAENIGVNVHYIPVHLHPYYQQRFGTGRGLCPVAEAAYDRMITLPIFPEMSEADADDVIEAVYKLEGLRHEQRPA